MLSAPFAIVMAATWRTPPAAVWLRPSFLPRCSSFPRSDDYGRHAEQADMRWREGESRKRDRQTQRDDGYDPQDLANDDAAARGVLIGKEANQNEQVIDIC
jgi:hypothetical protein